MDDDDMPPEEFGRRLAAGEPVEIIPGPRPTLVVDWAAEAAIDDGDTREWVEAVSRLWGEDWNSPEDAVYDEDADSDS